MADKSIGFIETFGLAACVAAADAAVKSANVKLLGFEYAKGGGMCTVKVEGNVGACKAAVEAGKKAAESVQGSLSGTKSVLLKARPAPSMRKLMVDNRETVGGEIAMAEGYRPKGESRQPVLVKNWKPKAEPKAETPMEEAPEPPVVEEPEKNTSDENTVTDSVKDQPEEAPKTEEVQSEEVSKEEDSVEEIPKETESQPEEAPKEEEAKPEETEPVAAPEAEKAPVAAPEEEPKEEAPAEEKKAETVTNTDAPAKKPSTGNRRSGRSRKKKNTDKNTDK